QLLKDGFVVNTILKEADLFCPNSVRINFTIYLKTKTLHDRIISYVERRVLSPRSVLKWYNLS
ncbi:hypothetical protein EFO98_15830, partial [Lactiplantibacillus argentoratensis]|nr:hypothetical protein [Lactiplantibacillus plantarum]MCT3262146.1 hypothetical protein [Lactiplantibacillus plantarum]MCT4441795.1 hypothetical protein [Lactiplantibacillus plantarum]MCT4445141.1 hypothetical protein [Lactiplantibacillus argentoratensis]